VRVLNDRYQLDEVIGHGATATVWRGWDLRLERSVAVKILDRPGLDGESGPGRRFADEARMLARLSHPNIVAVYDDGVQDGVAYFVMELVNGLSVVSRLSAGPLPPGEAAAIAVQVCDALTAAHAAGVIHRDVKPGNILVTVDGTVKVCDFGIARLEHATSITTANVALGTSKYMAPEQVEGLPVDGRTDLYALGCVLFTMLTGAPPFLGDSPMSVAYQHLHNDPPTLRSRRVDVPEGLNDLVARMLSKDPAARPDTAAQVRAELAAWAKPPIAIRPPAAAEPIIGPSRRQRLSRAGIATAAVAVVLPVIFFATQMSGKRSPSAVPPVASTSTSTVAAAVPSPIIPSVSPSPTPLATRQPSPRSTRSSSPTPAVPWTPLGEAIALRATVEDLLEAGEINQHDADDLDHMLLDLATSILNGKTGGILDRTAALQKKIDQLLDDGKISAAGHDVIAAGLARIAASPSPQ
jgi:eukaryotic-like serine/threonine-protein kinase